MAHTRAPLHPNLSLAWSRKAGAASLALLVLALGGCATPEARLPEPTRVNYNRAPLSEVVEELDERRHAVTTLVARLQVVLKDSQAGREYPLSGAYVGDKDGNWRLQMSHGETRVLDVAVRDGLVDLWLPRKGTYYRGRMEHAVEAGNDELGLLAHACGMHDLFFPRPWTADATERQVMLRDQREFVEVISKNGLFRRKALSMLVSEDKAAIDQITVYKRAGEKMGTILYDDYRFPAPRAGGAGQSPDTLPYPGRITLIGATAPRSIQLEIAELILNSPVPATRYEIPKEAGQKILDLEWALKNNISIW